MPAQSVEEELAELAALVEEAESWVLTLGRPTNPSAHGLDGHSDHS